MLHISLFSGIGGFDLAAESVGWKNIVSCEINDFGNKVLEYYFPNAYHHKDINTLNYETINNELSKRFGDKWRNDDIVLSGGFPCQPYSAAGKRLGKEDERHLWPEMLRIIKEIQPNWVVGENVHGIITWSEGLVFNEVQVDLETARYEVFPYVLPAAGVNAPHRRDRVWFVAHRNDTGNTALQSRTDGNGNTKSNQREQPQFEFSRSRNAWNATYPNSNGQQRRNSEHEINASEGRFNAQHDIEQIAMHTNSTGSKGEYFGQKGERKFDRSDCGNGTNNFQNFPTQSTICGRNDGIPRELDSITFPKWRNESIKAYGNAIVPQVAYQIFKTIEDYENRKGF